MEIRLAHSKFICYSLTKIFKEKARGSVLDSGKEVQLQHQERKNTGRGVAYAFAGSRLCQHQLRAIHGAGGVGEDAGL